MKIHYLLNHILYYIMSICIASVAVERLHQSLKKIENILGILKENILTIFLDIKCEVKEGLHLAIHGNKTYRKAVWVEFLGTRVKNGLKMLLKNFSDQEIALLAVKTQIGKVELIKKSEASGDRGNIYASKELLEKETKSVYSVDRTKDFMSTILNRLLITPISVTRRVMEDCFVLSVTGGHPILGAKQDWRWVKGI